MKIDAHVHIFSRDVAENRALYLDDSGFRLIYNNEKKSPSNNKGKTNISAPEKTPKNREAEQSNNDLERAKSEYAKALEESAKNKKQLLEIQQKYYDESYRLG